MIRVFVCARSVIELERLAAFVRSAPSLDLVGTALGPAALADQLANVRADILVEHYGSGTSEEYEFATLPGPEPHTELDTKGDTRTDATSATTAEARFERDRRLTPALLLVPEPAYAAALAALQFPVYADEPLFQDAFRQPSSVVLRGVLPLWASKPEICAAIDALHEGLLVLHPDVIEAAGSTPPTAISSAMLGPAADSTEAPLSPREGEILNLLAAGLGNKEIAWQLKISEHTVKFHVTSIFNKLAVSTRAEAVAVGMRRGLIIL